MPGTRNCGAISASIRYFGEPKILFNVNRNCFIPSPSVDSSVIEIKINKIKEVKNKEAFFKIIKAAFSKRRKNLLNSLSSGLKLSKSEVENILKEINISSNFRAENLSFKDFIDLSNLMKINS